LSNAVPSYHLKVREGAFGNEQQVANENMLIFLVSIFKVVSRFILQYHRQAIMPYW
jgi:hypothetical protein